MSLLKKASLIVTPNAYKEDVLYSVIPEDGSGDMDVVRATTATRVNEQGLIEVVPKNLLTYSEEFDDASWLKSGSGTAITANATNAPNGTLTADKWSIVVAGSRYVYQTPSISSGNVTASFFVKKDTSDWFFLNIVEGSNNAGYTFNVANGSLGQSISSGITPTASIIDFGNGWYRCSVMATVSSTSVQIRGYIARSSSSVSTAIGASLFVWGAQLEQGSTATSYFPTTDRLNIPRIDYTGGGCPSILVEPQRTNLVTASENFSNASWIKIGVNVQAGFLSPKGDLSAYKVSANGANPHMYGYSGINIGKRKSIYARAVNGNGLVNLLNVRREGNSNGLFELTEEWQRFDIEGDVFADLFYAVDFRNSLSTLNEIYIWGAQLEQGSYATSYIPTVASTVTRNADVISKTGISDLIGQTEGTMFVEMAALTNTQTAGVYMSVFASGTNFTSIGFITGTNRIIFEGIYGGVSIVYIYNAPFNVTINSKIAIAYQLNKLTGYVNGIKVFENITPQSFSQTLTQFKSDYRGLGNFLQANVKSFQLYKEALTDEELILLTGDSFYSYNKMANALMYTIQ